MGYEYQVEDNIIVFKFNNGKVNSITTETLQGLNEAVERLNHEEELKGMILTGAGRYFSGGFDLGTFTSFTSSEEIKDWFAYEEGVLLKVFTCQKPVVAAVNGHATAAGMIFSMACDYRLVMNNPKLKLGMTEIKIGLALTPTQGEIMRFGLDTDKKFRDMIYKGELINPSQAVELGIFDEVVETEEELIRRAKEQVCAYIDTPGRPFMLLKYLEKIHAADYCQEGLKRYDWDLLVKTFTDESVLNTLRMVKQALGA